MVKASGLYSFPNLKIQGQLYIATGSAYNSKFVVVDSSESSNLWHARLGHPNVMC